MLKKYAEYIPRLLIRGKVGTRRCYSSLNRAPSTSVCISLKVTICTLDVTRARTVKSNGVMNGGSELSRVKGEIGTRWILLQIENRYHLMNRWVVRWKYCGRISIIQAA